MKAAKPNGMFSNLGHVNIIVHFWLPSSLLYFSTLFIKHSNLGYLSLTPDFRKIAVRFNGIPSEKRLMRFNLSLKSLVIFAFGLDLLANIEKAYHSQRLTMKIETDGACFFYIIVWKLALLASEDRFKPISFIFIICGVSRPSYFHSFQSYIHIGPLTSKPGAVVAMIA